MGTAVMGALQAAAHRLQGKENGEPESWEEAPAPAEVGKRVWEGVLLRRAPEHRITLFTNVVHWSYGVSLACAFAVVEGSLERSRRPLRDGAAFGTAAWLLGSAVLTPAARLAKPPWTYPLKTNALDLGYHVVYGVVTAQAFELLRRL